ncbi:tail fiber domain-containing protein, partial [Candidatus Woesebacteria bacterium]|nr:tail fiber domain-containing protein [Candidatus Woesebacteria bacterium]
NSTDQVKLNSSKAAGGTTTEAFSVKTSTDLGAADEIFQLGDSAADFLTIRGDGNVGIGTTALGSKLQVAGSITPSANDTYDLGSNSLRWQDLYLGGDTLHIGTSTTDEGTIGYDTSGNILNFGTDSTTNGDIAFFTDNLYLDKSAGNVGIGTTAPTTKLTVIDTSNTAISGVTAAATKVGVYGSASTAAGYGVLGYNNNAAGVAMLAQQDSTGFALYALGGKSYFTGNVGIGSATPAYMLDVKSSTVNIARFNGSNSTGCTLGGTGVLACSSDRNLKNTIQNSQLGLDALMNLRPVTFNWNFEAPGSPSSIGFIAQEVEQVAPNLVSTDTSTGYKQLNTIGIVPIIVKAAQEQQSLIATNTQKVANLEITFDEFGLLSLNSTASGSAQLITTATATPINDRFGAFTNAIAATFEAGLTKTKNLIVSGQAQIANLSVTNLNIGGQSLRDYIVSIIQEAPTTNPVIPDANTTPDTNTNASGSAWLAEKFHQDEVTGQPIVEDLSVTDTLSTATVSATTITSNSLTVTGQTQLGSLMVNQNASVAGVFTTNELDANSARIDALEAGVAQLESVKATTAEFANATVSGTLYAKTIADLDKQIASLLEQPSLMSVITGSIPSPQTDYTSLFQAIGNITSTASQAAQLDQSIADLNLADDDIVLTASAGFIDRYFKVNGIAYVSDSLGVGNSLRVGTKVELTDSYLSFAADPTTPDELAVFSIQPSGKGLIAIMGNLMTLDETGQVTINGNLHVAGNVSVEGSLLANMIQPTNPGGNISLNLGQSGLGSDATTSGGLATPSARFEVLGNAGSPVATVSAQGQASFAGLSLDRDILARPQVAGAATNSGQLTQEATQTTGKAILPAGNTQLIIKNPNVKADSLIYLTPQGSTQNQVLYVKTTVAPVDEATALPTDERAFIVGLDGPAVQDISFTWWIVN